MRLVHSGAQSAWYQRTHALDDNRWGVLVPAKRRMPGAWLSAQPAESVLKRARRGACQVQVETTKPGSRGLSTSASGRRGTGSRQIALHRAIKVCGVWPAALTRQAFFRGEPRADDLRRTAPPSKLGTPARLPSAPIGTV